MESKIFERLQEFTAQHQGLDKIEITENSDLENDLGIYGDDAVDYLIAFGKEFNVDVTNFMAADYFNPEGMDLFGAISRIFTGKKKQEKKILTIKHLERAVIAGRLDEEVINTSTIT